MKDEHGYMAGEAFLNQRAVYKGLFDRYREGIDPEPSLSEVLILGNTFDPTSCPIEEVSGTCDYCLSPKKDDLEPCCGCGSRRFTVKK